MTPMRRWWQRQRWQPKAGVLSVSVFLASAAFFWWLLDPRPRFTVRGDDSARAVGMDLAPDGTLLAVARKTGDRLHGPVQVWEVATGRLRATLGSEEQDLGRVVFSPDGRLLAITRDEEADESQADRFRTHVLVLWNLPSGDERTSLRELAGFSFAFSPDGRTIVYDRDVHNEKGEPLYRELRLWDVTTGQDRATLKPDVDPHWAFSIDSRLFATTATQKLPSMRLGKMFLAVAAWACHPVAAPGSLLMLFDNRDIDPPYENYFVQERPIVQVWDIAAGQQRMLLPVIVDGRPSVARSIRALALAPEGQTLAAAVEVLVDTSEREAHLLTWDVRTGQQCASLRLQLPVRDPFRFLVWYTLAFAPQGRYAVVERYTLVETEKSSVLCDLSAEPPRQLLAADDPPVFSADGSLVAVSNSCQEDSKTTEKRAVRVLELATLEPQCVCGLPWYNSRHLTPLAFSPDGRALAVRSSSSENGDHDIRIFDLSTGHCQGRLTGWKAVFTPESMTVITFGDNRCSIYDLPLGTPCAAILLWSAVPAGLAVLLGFWCWATKTTLSTALRQSPGPT
jgi:WD40 repeat protein